MLNKVKESGFEEKQFFTGEIKLNYVVGPANGLPLILIPGQAATWENYQKVLVPLSEKFHVFALDIRGHGKSEWATGNYSFKSIGQDMLIFLEKVVKRPAIISGNSSGGLIAVWMAANIPEYVLGIIAEDAPLFSADWPRIKNEFVYRVLTSTVEIVNVLKESNSIKELSDALKKIERPIKGTKKTRKLPGIITYIVAVIIRFNQLLTGKKSIKASILPGKLKLVIETLLNYDPDFSKSWVDGRIYEGLNHEEALKKVECPMLILHANWFRHAEYGLVGAMDDKDAKHACELVKNCQYKRIESDHVIHSDKPLIFIHEIEEFIQKDIIKKA
ncbi:MAG: alpha/beta fold hydrolase [Methanomicrobiales archaeon]